jgi:hypothetical protein
MSLFPALNYRAIILCPYGTSAIRAPKGRQKVARRFTPGGLNFKVNA